MKRYTGEFKWKKILHRVTLELRDLHLLAIFSAEPVLKQSIYAGLDAFNVAVLRTALIRADVFIFLAKGYSYIDVIITNFVAERR